MDPVAGPRSRGRVERRAAETSRISFAGLRVIARRRGIQTRRVRSLRRFKVWQAGGNA